MSEGALAYHTSSQVLATPSEIAFEILINLSNMQEVQPMMGYNLYQIILF